MTFKRGEVYTVEALAEEDSDEVEEVEVFVVSLFRSYESYDEEEGLQDEVGDFVMFTTEFDETHFVPPFRTEPLDSFIDSVQ